MVLTFMDVFFEEGKAYPAEITNLIVDQRHECVRIMVKIRKYDHISFWKSIPYELDTNSELYRILDYLGVVSKNRVHKKSLEGMEVFVTMNRGKGEYARWYVREIFLPEDVETEQSDEFEDNDSDDCYCDEDLDYDYED